MNEKIIFLDIDGVMNCELEEEGDSVYSFKPGYTISKRCLKLLNTLIADTGAKVVISSTWRRGFKLEDFQAKFRGIGFKGEILGFTPTLGTLRGIEILEWIKTNIETPYHAYEKYVILDDDSDMLYWQKDNFLLIDGYCGLTDRVVYKASWILNR